MMLRSRQGDVEVAGEQQRHGAVGVRLPVEVHKGLADVLVGTAPGDGKRTAPYLLRAFDQKPILRRMRTTPSLAPFPYELVTSDPTSAGVRRRKESRYPSYRAIQ